MSFRSWSCMLFDGLGKIMSHKFSLLVSTCMYMYVCAQKYHDQPSDWQKIMQSKVVSRERSKEPDMELSTRVDPCNTHFIKLASLIMDMMRDDVLQTTMATQRTHKTVQKQFTGTWASWR